MHSADELPESSKTPKAQGLQPLGFKRPPDGGPVPYGSNDLRLSPREWLVAGVIAAAAFWAIPVVWQRVEPVAFGPDYRMPYDLSEDYWLYRRYCRHVCAQDRVLVIGDSVMWGQYVSARETLPQWLNGLAGADRFANLGVNGTYPVALAGLVEHYGHAIAGKSVLLFCNPLWMSSDKYDLKDAKEVGYHPRLVPQFFPRIPAYHESFDGKLGVVIQRNIALVDWVNHLRMAYFESTDIAKWTQDHPYANPLRAITLELPLSQDPAPGAETRLWTGQDDERYNPLWVDLQGSLQWAAFRRTIEILQGRGNRVFVLVGPFNEHMLKSPSLATYQEMKKGVAAWLEEKRIVYYVPPALPSELYADASHPLAAGYQRLARQLWEDKAFLEFVRGD